MINNNCNNFYINEFQIPNTVYNQGKSFGIFLLTGKKESGKTTITKKLIEQFIEKNVIEDTIIFSHDSNNQHNTMIRCKENYNDIVTNSNNIYSKLKEKHLKKIIKMQHKNNAKPLLLILDGVVDTTILQSEYFNDIILNGAHHLKITMIISMQYPCESRAELTMNFDYIFAFKEEILSIKQQLHKHYFGMIPNYEAFDTIMMQLCNNTCLVAVQNAHSANISNNLKYYKTKITNNNNLNKITVTKLSNKILNKTKDFVYTSKSKQLVLTLNKFKIHNLSTFYDNSFGKMLIVGQRGEGTTSLIKNLIVNITKNNCIKKTILVTHMRNNYENVFSNCSTIYETVTNELLKNIINMQCNKNSEPLLLIFDDVMFNKYGTLDFFKEIMFNGVSYKITLIISIQFPSGVSPEIRNNFDYIFAFKEDFMSNKKRLFEHYFGIIPKYKIFNSFIYALDKYECLVTINREKSNNIINKLKYYKIVDMCDDNLENINKITLFKFDDDDDDDDNDKQTTKHIINLININNKKIKTLQAINNELLKKLIF